MKTPKNPEVENNFSIKYWAEDDQPREKMMVKGKASLSDAELVAILIGSGNRDESAVELSKKILASVKNNLNLLGKMTLNELTAFKGIGAAKAVTIAAAMELGRRRRGEEAAAAKFISSGVHVFELMQPLLGDLEHEEFWVIYINRAKKFLHKSKLSTGGFAGTVVDVRMIFKKGIELNASGVILVHNHPSGRLTPSEEDIKITKTMIAAGNLLEIVVYDHVIISDRGYYSFKDDVEKDYF